MDGKRKSSPRAPSTYTLVVGETSVLSGPYSRLLGSYNALAAFEQELKKRNSDAIVSLPAYFIRAGLPDDRAGYYNL